MVFSSIPFLFFFLPLCLILYYGISCPAKYIPDVPCRISSMKHLSLISFRNSILLVFSLIFYAWGEPVYILLMLFSSAVDFVNGLLMERFGNTRGKRRFFLACSIITNLSVLAFFKYAAFMVGTVNCLL